MESSFRVDAYRTRIPALDELMDGGLPHRSVVLITGRPGTGKTTLALQILAHAALHPKSPLPTAFLTFDEEPEEAFRRFRTSYDFGLTDKHYRYVESANRKLPVDKEFIRIVANPSQWLSTLVNPIQKRSRDLTQLFKVVSDCGIWVIDGMNCLLEEIDPSDGEKINRRLRTLQQNIRRVFLEKQGDIAGEWKVVAQPPQIVIVTAESESDRLEYIYESYMADVVVRLEYREFVPDSRYPMVRERLLVCSAPKGRGIHVQRREMCYEFVPGSGIRFFPTYPAAGQLSLFAENKPQSKLIDDFSEADVPTLFPGLSVRHFGRSNLYHEYSIRRRTNEMPSRYDLRASSLDEYWTRSLRHLLAPLPIDKLHPYGMTLKALIPEILKNKKQWLLSDNSTKIHAVPYIGNVGLFVVNRATGISPRHTKNGVPFLTWEQVEEYCTAAASKDGPLVFEMKTLDSFMAFVLELCWSHRGGWYTIKEGRSLDIRYEEGHSATGTLEALRRFHRWIHELRIVRPYSTLSVGHPTSPQSPPFSRHWYSTLVDTLTSQKPDERRVRSRDVRVLPIPVPESRVTSEIDATDFHSAWGEWYLGTWRGTENVELAIELINTITSSRWQINAAITGAALPVYEPFFEEFGDCKCFCTDLTYNEVKEYFYGGAFSRGKFSEYRFVMQRFYAGVLTLVSNPNADVEKVWNGITTRIKNWSP